MIAYFSQLEEQLKTLEIKNGDVLYVASDVSLLLYEVRKTLGIRTVEQRNEFLDNLVNHLQGCVGSEGTLLFPIFNWDFCCGKGFDYWRTKGETGALPNWVLGKRKDFTRTQHPMFSFMVWGKDAGMLKKMDNKLAWGKDSPFAYLHNQKAKLLLLNVSLQRGFTFMHYVEQNLRVPYRYLKAFRGKYIDEFGVQSERVYSMYVRDLAIEAAEHLPEQFLDKAGAAKTVLFGLLSLKLVDLASAYQIVEQDLLRNKGRNCYTFGNYELDYLKGATHDDEVSNGIS